MSRLGRVNYRERIGAFLAGGGKIRPHADLAQRTDRAWEIDEEVKRIIAEGLERVKQILQLAARRSTRGQAVRDKGGGEGFPRN